MNLQQLEEQVHFSVQRDDMQGMYKAFINQAVADVCERWNFVAMRQSDLLTMKQGESAVRLPADFKELQSRNKSPIMVRNTDKTSTVSFFPVDIRTEQEVRRINSRNTGFSTIPTIPVWVDYEDDSWFIFIDAVQGQDTDFRVLYYRKLPALEDPTDENGITRSFPRMIYSRARQLAFETINDPQAGSHQVIYDVEFKGNSGYDAGRRYHGRNLRM
jgi:hypothetical protein